MSIVGSWIFLITIMILFGAIGFILAYIGIHWGDRK